MNNIIYKVALPGEGKTRWLLEQAKRECDNDEHVVLITNGNFIDREYRSFSEDYVDLYKEVCPVQPVNKMHDIEEGSVVLIDDLFHLDIHMIGLRALQHKAKRVYITVDGVLDLPWLKDNNQITIFEEIE